MNEKWQSFISQHAKNSTDELNHNEGLFFDLSSEYGILEFSGEDAQTYLQGQLTNDINEINNEAAQISGYCNPKGRLLALFYIFSIDNKFYFQFPANLLAKTLKRMQMFVMMSKVVIKDVSNELINIGLSGDMIESLLHTSLNNEIQQKITLLPKKNNEVVSLSGLTIIKLSDKQDYNNATTRYQCIGNLEKIQSLSSQLFAQGIKQADFSTWQSFNIQAGIPSVDESTREAFVPQMINLHLLNAINFKKGCYTGQEVVARMHYLGKLKRLMYLLSIDEESDNTVLPGDKLYSPESNSGQGAGKVVSVSGSTMLAVVEVSVADKNAIFLDEEHSIKLTIGELPYCAKLEEDNSK